MAVTGSGTKTDPFIVHSYDEIKNWASYGSSHDGSHYLRLDNDIDCNDYGDTWEWENIEIIGWLGNGYSSLNLDLNGHTIKNIIIGNGQRLFSRRMDSTPDDLRCGVAKIHNGKILNIFNNSSGGICHGVDNGRDTDKVVFENISMSINGNSIFDDLFYNVSFNKCSIYFVRNTEYDKHLFTFRCNYVAMSNCDLYIDYPEAKNPMIYNTNSGFSLNIQDCRFRGKIGTHAVRYGSPVGCGMSNCVVDMNVKDLDNQWYAFANSGTGVINTSKLDGVTKGDMIAVTDAELKSAAALQAKGFNVVKVGG